MGQNDTPRDTSGRAAIAREARATVTPTVAVLVLGRQARARILGALASRFTVRFCERGDQLRALATHPATVAVIVEPRDDEGVLLAPLLETFREGVPTLPLVAYVRWNETSPADVLALARAGVDEIVRAGVDDTEFTLRATLAGAAVVRLASEVRREVSALADAEARPIVEWVLNHAHEQHDVEGIASALGLSRRTISRRLSRAGLPRARELSGWCRLLLAARLMEDPLRTLESIAFAFDFGSGAGLRNMLQRYTGLRPREVRENGGMRCVLHLLRRRVSADRATAVHQAP